MKKIDVNLTDAMVITPEGAVLNAHVLVRNGVVENILPAVGILPEDSAKTINCAGCFVSAGFIDAHINGSYPVVPEEQSWEEFYAGMSLDLPRYGVTAFVPTIYTCKFELVVEKLKAITRVAANLPEGGARIVGVHLEGPFISPDRIGSHPPGNVLEPTPERLETLWQASGELLKIITLAPEIPGARQAVDFCLARGIIPSIGHTCADYDTTKQAIDWGMKFATHMFNAMSAFSHRSPGAAGAVMEDPCVACEIICDGNHVHPAAVGMLVRLKGIDELVLVSDGISARKGPDGTFFEGRKAYSRSGALWMEGHVLAGSTTMLNRALKLFRQATGVGIVDCIKTVTSTPASVLGLNRGFAGVCLGHNAGLCVFDHDFDVKLCVLPEKIRYLSRRKRR